MAVPLNTMAAASAGVLLVAAAWMLALPEALADDTAIVHNPVGSSVPGCEETDEGCFIPSTVTIDVGGEVTWVNDDAAAHTVTSGILADGGPDGVFDSSLLSPATSFSHKFEEIGEYPYFCLVHPWMEGLVIVQEATATDGDDMMMGEGDKMDDRHDDDKMMGDKMDDAHDDYMMMDEEATATGALSDGTPVMIKTTEVSAGEPLRIKVIFEDSEHVNYDIMVMQGEEEVLNTMDAHEHMGKGEHMTGALPTGDPVDITVTFQGYGVDEITGPVGDDVIFANVVPEFGTIAVVILAAAIISIVAVSARSRLSIIPRY
jgi:predicted secreted protein with PEFG-CTERM motif